MTEEKEQLMKNESNRFETLESQNPRGRIILELFLNESRTIPQKNRGLSARRRLDASSGASYVGLWKLKMLSAILRVLHYASSKFSGKFCVVFCAAALLRSESDTARVLREARLGWVGFNVHDATRMVVVYQA